MDLLKAKVYLDKINREFARMAKDPDNIARIDVDIMMSYIREFYDAYLTEKTTPTPVPPAPKAEPVAPSRPVVAPPAETPAPKPADPPPPPAPAPPPPPVVPDPPPPVVTRPPEPVVPPAPPAPPVVEEKPAPAAPSPTPEPARPHVAHHGSHHLPPEAEALFEQKQAKELSEKLSELPVADLRKAIALNDRLLLTRELFGGDAQAFETAIAALNSYTSFDQAKHYLLENCVMRYHWTEKKHLETARNFIKLVRRRYK